MTDWRYQGQGMRRRMGAPSSHLEAANSQEERRPQPCPPKCAHCRRHREKVRAYHEAREAQDARVEQEAMGYATEKASYYEQNQPVTLKWWLQQTKE